MVVSLYRIYVSPTHVLLAGGKGKGSEPPGRGNWEGGGSVLSIINHGLSPFSTQSPFPPTPQKRKREKRKKKLKKLYFVDVKEDSLSLSPIFSLVFYPPFRHFKFLKFPHLGRRWGGGRVCAYLFFFFRSGKGLILDISMYIT